MLRPLKESHRSAVAAGGSVPAWGRRLPGGFPLRFFCSIPISTGVAGSME